MWFTGLRVLQEDGSLPLPPGVRAHGVPDAHLAFVQPTRPWVGANHVTTSRIADQCSGLRDEAAEARVADHTHRSQRL